MEPAERTLTADELVEQGRERARQHLPVVFLYPSQEWMAVKNQTPFLRYGVINAQPE